MRKFKNILIIPIIVILLIAIYLSAKSIVQSNALSGNKKIDTVKKSVVTILSGFDIDNGILTDNYTMGSGFVYDKTKIVTNAHNIQSENISILTYDNNIIPAKLIAADQINDIAIIQANIELPSLKFCNNGKYEIGDIVHSIYTPLSAYLKNSYSSGIITNNNIMGLSNQKLIQTDIAISPGCSGSPLLNNKFQVIGMLSFKSTEFGSDRLGFAIPHNIINDCIDKLEAGKKNLDLKISFKNDIYKKYGLPKKGITIENIDEDSKAYNKLQNNDLILKINDYEIDNITLYYEAIRKYEGEELLFIVIRDEQQIEIKI